MSKIRQMEISGNLWEISVVAQVHLLSSMFVDVRRGSLEIRGVSESLRTEDNASLSEEVGWPVGEHEVSDWLAQSKSMWSAVAIRNRGARVYILSMFSAKISGRFSRVRSAWFALLQLRIL